MNKDSLIAKQQLEIETQREIFEENRELILKIRMKFIAIGAPLNDNILQFNHKQLQWVARVLDLIEQLK